MALCGGTPRPPFPGLRDSERSNGHHSGSPLAFAESFPWCRNENKRSFEAAMSTRVDMELSVGLIAASEPKARRRQTPKERGSPSSEWRPIRSARFRRALIRRVDLSTECLTAELRYRSHVDADVFGQQSKRRGANLKSLPVRHVPVDRVCSGAGTRTGKCRIPVLRQQHDRNRCRAGRQPAEHILDDKLGGHE